MHDMLFPVPALAILREARWDANASRSYEILSDGFHWSDEQLFGEVSHLCVQHKNWAFRFLITYRSSLIRGAPRNEFQPTWDQLSRECPEWPGFHQARCSQSLAAELEAASLRSQNEMDELDARIRRHMEEKQRMTADSK